MTPRQQQAIDLARYIAADETLTATQACYKIKAVLHVNEAARTDSIELRQIYVDACRLAGMEQSCERLEATRRRLRRVS